MGFLARRRKKRADEAAFQAWLDSLTPAQRRRYDEWEQLAMAEFRKQIEEQAERDEAFFWLRHSP